MRAPNDLLLARERLQQCLEEENNGNMMSAKELATSLARAEGLTKDAAEMRVEQVLRLCGFTEGTAISAEEFSRDVAAFDLGQFKELGAGDGLVSTSKTGAKFYEGGPYNGTPLDIKRLKENMMVQDDIENVMVHVGGGQQAPDWSHMWPYGVFRCNYEFEERLLP